MTFTVKVHGFSDLAKRLAELPHAVSHNVQVKALRVGAEPIRAEASRLAPRGGQGYPHLADNIVISAPTIAALERAGQFEQAVVFVGPSTRHFYGYFLEYGTRFMSARPFMRPAFDTQAQTSLNRILTVFWLSLRQKLPQSFGRGITSRAA